MQSRNPIFADLADLMTDAFSAAQAAGEEAKGMFRAQAERVASELDLISREEFEAVKAELAALSSETESLRTRLAALEAGLASAKAPAKSAAKRSTTKKSSS